MVVADGSAVATGIAVAIVIIDCGPVHVVPVDEPVSLLIGKGK